jgi:hypothetical protein
MGIGGWLRVIDTVSDLATLAGRFRRRPDGESATAGLMAGPLGQLETRLAGVVVAALKEAFDRDRVRMELERAHMEAERARAEEALRAELRRQAAERTLGQLRLVAIMAIAVWMLSAVLAVLLPGLRGGVPVILLGTGWACAVAALGCAFSAWQRVSVWTADLSGGAGAVRHPSATAALWLLLASVAVTGMALLGGLIAMPRG